MDKIITVVIPSYNVEQYLEQTLSSFVEKYILDKIEVLVVDDGSKDDTAIIGKRYEEQYPGSFRVISKENGGHGSTINRGIEEATGKYFKVVDGDDWVDTEGFTELVNRLGQCDVDYVVTDYYEVDDNTKEKTAKIFSELAKNEVLSFEEVATNTQIPMHALVIKTSILKDNRIRLDEHCFYVDVEYTLYPVPYVEEVIYYDIFVYMYRLAVVTQSVSMQGFKKHIDNHLLVIEHLIDFLNDCKKKGVCQIKQDYIIQRLGQMSRDQLNIFMSYDVKEPGIKEKFQKFDNMLKEKNQLVYELSGTYSGMLQVLRKTSFIGYKLIMRYSKWRNRGEV